MADELLCCPTCSRKVRLAEQHLGWIVQCPLCRAVFRAPVGLSPLPPPVDAAVPPVPEPAPPAVSPWSDDSGEEEDSPEESEAVAARSLLVPGLMLLIQGVVGLLAVLTPVLVGRTPLDEFWTSYIDDEATKNYPAPFVALLRQTPPLVLTGVSAALSVGTLIGAVHILRLRRYPLALVGSALVMGNLFYPGCQWFLNCFLGVWTLRTLRSPDVRDAFE